MIIAITANGDTTGAPVSGSLQRCRQIIIYDTDLGDIIEAADNPEREIVGGGGREAAEIIAQYDTEILITGDVDPEAGDVLAETGVQVQICFDGSVQSAIDRCLAGALPLSEGPSRGSFAGPGSPETPHSREASPGSDPGQEERDEEVVGVEEECVCLSCGYTLPHEPGSPECEVTPCPRCGANMSRHLIVE